MDVRYPPRPIEIAPAHNSARPPVTTSLELPRPESPAVRAKGTVNPSDRPTILNLSVHYLMHRLSKVETDLHITNDLWGDKVSLILSFQVLTALSLPLMDRAFRVQRISR